MSTQRNLFTALVLTGGLLISLGGCATSRPDPVASNPDYQFLMGEIALARGRVHVAVDAYMQAARQLQDPEVVRRALQIAVHANDMTRARLLADQWERLTPDDPELIQYQGVLQLRAGRTEAAFQYLSRLANAESADVTGANLQMLTAMLAGEENVWRAADVMARLAAASETRPEGWQGAALLALEADRPEQAQRFAARSLALQPGNADAAFLLVRAGLAANPGAGSKEKLQMLKPLARYKNDPDPGMRYRYASLLVMAGQHAEADAVFEDILVHDPLQHDVRLARALLALDHGRLDEAEDHLRNLLEQHERLPDVLYYLGTLAEQRGDPTAAAQWYSRIAPRAPDLSRWLAAQLALARITAQRQGIDAASRYFDELRGQWPELATELTVNEAALLTAQGHPQRALERIDQLASVTSSGARDLDWQIALAAAEAGATEQAEGVLRALLERDPGNPLLLNSLAYLLIEQTDRLAEAEGLLNQALSAAPANPSILDSAGWLRFRQGSPATARALLEESWQRAPAVTTGAHLLAVLQVLEDGDAAEALRQELHRRFPERFPGLAASGETQ